MTWILALLWLTAACQALTATCWWVSWYYQRRLKLEQLRLVPVTTWPADRPAPSLAVVIACHNEENGIEDCIRRLQGQNYPNMQIVVCNDRSTDRTGEILQRLPADDPRIRVVNITELPPGWTGKTHAVSVGVRASTSDYILFMDSDVVLSPHAILTVMDKVCRDDLDFFSFWPRLELRGRSEKLLTPAAMLLLSMWTKPYRSGKDIASKAIMGNGQFLLMKRRSYEAIGGHESVAAELAEDAILAFKAHQAGQRCWSGPGDGLYVTYREGDFSRTVNSLARVFIGSLRSHWRLWAGTQVLMGGAFAPGWILPTAAVCLAIGLDRTLCLTFLIIALVHWAGIVVSLRRAFAMTLIKRGSLIWFPYGAAVIVGVLIWSSYLLAGWGTLRWGKTRYRVKGSQITAVAGQ